MEILDSFARPVYNCDQYPVMLYKACRHIGEKLDR